MAEPIPPSPPPAARPAWYVRAWNKIRGVWKGLKPHLSQHLFFWIGTIGIIVLFMVMPQVSNIYTQGIQAVLAGHGWRWAGVVLFVLYALLILLWYFVGSFLAVVPWTGPDGKLWFESSCFPLRCLTFLADRFTTGILFALGGIRRRLPGGSVLLLAAVMISCFAIGARPERDLQLTAAIWNAGFISLAILLLMLSPKDVTASWRPSITGTHALPRSFGRVVAWFILTALLGEIVWLLHSCRIFGAYPIYTLWTFGQLGATLIIAGSLIDYWHHKATAPIRLVAIGAAFVALLLFQGPDPIGRLVRDPKSVGNSGAADSWFKHMSDRLEAMDRRRLPGPAVIVVASGGGSRAAIFTSLILEKLANQKMDIPGIRQVPGADDSSTWADHILMISSVSGGSLATAHYVQRGGGRSPKTAGGELQSISMETLRLQVQEQFNDWIQRLKEKKPSSKEELALLAEVEDAYTLVAREPLDYTFFDDMGIDFIAPVLRGTMTPFLGRGPALGRFWTDQFRWGDSNQSTGYSKKPGDDPAYDPEVHPIVLFNATDADRGTRLIIGYPPLPPNMVVMGCESRSGEDRAPHELRTLQPNIHLSLAETVRLSANFPWGFPIARIELADGTDLHLLDGGVVDNTGLDSVQYVLGGLAEFAKTNPAAAAVLEKLRKRGVTFVEIDSGAKPDHHPSRKPWGWAINPSKALQNAAYTNGDLAWEQHRKAIEGILLATTSGDKSGNAAVRWHPFRCNHYDPGTDVMTSWALGPKDKAIVVSRYLVELIHWKILKARESRLLETAQKNANQATTALEESRERTERIRKDLGNTAALQANLDGLLKEYKSQETLLSEAQGNLDPAETDAQTRERLQLILRDLRDAQRVVQAAKRESKVPDPGMLQAWNAKADVVRRTISDQAQQKSLKDLKDAEQKAARQAAQFFEAPTKKSAKK